MTLATLFLPIALMGTSTATSPQVGPLGTTPGAVCDRDGNGAVLPGHREFFWPDVHPVWAFCAIRPLNSTTQNGSGLEIYNVRFRDRLVFKRAHAPILNVLYLTGCGCFRDWSDSEFRYEATNQVAPGFADTPTPARTVCENAGVDLGSFNGVATENRDNQELVLTTQMQAGWYRYVMRWRFYPDGRLVGWFGFAAVSASCVSHDHTHHNYWRLDFDIDGAGNDYIYQARTNAKPMVLNTEAKTLRGPAYWIIRDGPTGRGFKLTPGNSIAPDTFANSDLWFLRYKPAEVDDSTAGHGCAINIDPFLNGESIRGQDVVVWLRGGEFHQGGDFDHCGQVDFTLEPVGDW